MEAVRDTFIVVAMLLALAVQSWGACSSIGYVNGNVAKWDVGPCQPNFSSYSASCAAIASNNGTSLCRNNGNRIYAGLGSKQSEYCSYEYQMSCSYFAICCGTQAEADSVACANDPTLPQCVVETDTTLWACSEDMVNGAPVARIYRLECRAQNGVVVSCNGKQNVDIETDGQMTAAYGGTCAQNGYENGVQSGGGPQDSTGVNGDCFAITGATCHMKDPVSGNTWRCDCDGDCNVAVRMMAQGQCRNPYEQSSASDSLHLGSSGSANSSASSSGSEGSSGSSSPSSSGSGGSSGSGEDFEYDYTAVLEDIRANTQYTGQQARDLNGKAATANDLLQQIANKDFSPTINVGGPNVTLNADTARAPAAILGLLQDKLAGGEPNSADTAGSGAQLDGIKGSIDSLLSSTGALVESVGDSVPAARASFSGAASALADSMTTGIYGDSVAKWEGMLLNNGTLTGSGSDNCPSILRRTWRVTIKGNAAFTMGPLGSILCAAVPGAGVTFWALCRVLIRALVAITCMWWLYRAVTGTDGGGSDED